ncbi:MAG: beta strand repeat-containing protein, partial [Trebonia sp.]
TTGSLIGDGTLSGVIGGGSGTATLGNANTLATLGDFSAGTLVLNDGTALAIAGTVNTSSLDVSAASVTETTGSLIGDDTLSGVIGGAAILNQPNTLAVLGNFSAGTLNLNDTSALGIAGTVDVPVIDITAASLTETTGSIIGNGTLTGQLAGAAQLGNPNAFAVLGNFTAPTGLSLTDTEALSVNGAVNAGPSAIILLGNNPLSVLAGSEVTAGNITLSAGSMAVDGLVHGGTSVALFSGAGNVTEDGTGTIVTPGTLTGNISGNAVLNGPSNVIAVLGSFVAGGSITLDAIDALSIAGPVTAGTLTAGAPIAVTDAGALSVPGVMNAGSITLTADSIALTGTLQGTAAVDLVTTTGDLIEEGVGTIDLPTGTLTGAIAGSAALDGSNTIGALGSFLATGSIILDNAHSLDVVSTVSAGPSMLLNTGSNDLTVAAGGLVNAGSVTLDGGNLLLYGDVSGAQAVSLGARGTISETGALDTALLTGSATATA